MNIDYKKINKEKINYINNNFKMSEVVKMVTGEQCDRNGFLYCPIHGHRGKEYNCSINIKKGDNIITCWSEGCLEGSGIFNFLDKYLREIKNINDWKEVYKAIDDILGTDLYIKPAKKENPIQEVIKDFTHEFKIDKYCSEVEKEIQKIILNEGNSVINAGTGLGKTYMLTQIGKNLSKIYDNVIYLTSRRSLVEEIAEKYNYKAFMGNDFLMPDFPTIVATTHKSRMINYSLSDEIGVSITSESILESFSKSYVLIVDECHLLHTSRNIIGNIEALNELIKKADLVIFTSANTKHFYKAFKNEYSINKYINIERKEKAYNLDNLDIIRLESKKDDRIEFVFEKYKNEKNKLLVINNNIKENIKLAEMFKNFGKIAIEINANNKDSEAYENIIKKSLLSCEVTICTSVLDTGININTKGVTTVILADLMQFDDISIIQGFARTRSLSGGNKGVLILNKKEQKVKRNKQSDIKDFIEINKEIAEKNCMRFNEHMFNYYDCNSYEEYKIVWNFLKENELYNPTSSMLKIITEKYKANPRMCIDETMIYENSRKEYLRDNYYIDSFIKEIVKEINCNKINFINEKFSSEKEKDNIVENTNFKDSLIEILEDETMLKEIQDFYINELEIKEQDLLNKLFEADENKAKDMNKFIRSLIKLYKKNNLNLDIKKVIEKVLLSYTLDKKSEINFEIKKIKYIVYNNIYTNKIEYLELDTLGDLYYSIIRESLDNLSSRRGVLTEKAKELMIYEYCSRKGYTLEKGVYKNKGKKVNTNKILNNIEQLIKCVYNQNENGRINTLIKKIS